MTTRKLIDITNHPDFDDVTRKVDIVQSINSYKTNCIDLHLEVLHFKGGVQVDYFPKVAVLMGDNQDFVDPKTGDKVEWVDTIIYVKDDKGSDLLDANGNKVQDYISSEYPQGSMGEYDYLHYVVNVAKAYTQEELEEIYVGKRVDMINKKLYS